jgi:malate dehydrogenase
VEKQIAHGVLLDIVPGLPQGIALDLMEARGIERHDCTLMGTNDYDDLQDMDLMVITAGKPRKPGMNRADLLEINGKIVAEAAKQAISRSPNAILLVVTNPLDAMTYTAWKASELPPHRVLGMAGVLDSARLQTFIALELGVSILDVTTMVLGSHGDAMVPLPRYCTVNGIPITELLATEAIQRIVARTQQGGAEIVKLMQTGSAFYAPAAAACLMVEAILTDRSRVVPATCYLQGEYGLRDLYLGVPARLGRRGIEEILELKLQPSELATLGRSATTIQNQIAALQPLLSSL